MIGKAFCGNGFIHLNIAEFHEEDIGGPEKVCSDWQSGHEMSDFGVVISCGRQFSKKCRLRL